MRRMVLLVALCLGRSVAAEEPGLLTFDDIVRRAAPDREVLARAAVLARMERELAMTGKHTREGPLLEAEAGPRRLEDGARKLQASARIEIPFLAGGGARSEADSRLRGSSQALLAADAVESHLRLRAAYLDAWFEQERLLSIEAQAQAIEQAAASVRKRVESGAEASYEASLIDGEMLRLRADADAARAARGDAWASLGALAELPAAPQPLASPGAADLGVSEDASSRFEAGAMRRAASDRGALGAAFLDLERGQRRSRWSAAATIAKEADESYATLGAAYRFPVRGESAAFSREREATASAIARESRVEESRLASRFAAATERAKLFGPVADPGEFDGALRAIALRMELGKDRPSSALPVRRQLLESREAALQRVRDAHLLIAEIAALTAGGTP